MTIDVNHTVSKNQPVFQMLDNDMYSDEGTEFYESKNGFEPVREHHINIFEPRITSKVTINEQISNTSQDRFESIQNDNISEVEEAIETHLTLDETIDDLEAQKRQSEKNQFIEKHEEEPLEEDESDISEKVQSSQSSLLYGDNDTPTAATQSDKSQKGSLDLLDTTSSSSLNLESTSPGSLHEKSSTPELSSDDESVKNHKAVVEQDINEDDDEKEEKYEFEIKDFTSTEEDFMGSINSLFSFQMINKSKSFDIPEFQQIHEDITMEPTKPKSKTVRYKLVRTFYNKCIQKYHSAKTWITVTFKPRRKYDQQLNPKWRSAENVATVRLESFGHQRVSHSVENFSLYTASISMTEEELSSPFAGVFTPIYNNQRKTESIMSFKMLQEPFNDASSAVVNIRQLCEEKFYYNSQ